MGSNLLKFVAPQTVTKEVELVARRARGCRWIGAERSSDVAIVAVGADVNRMCRGLARGSCSSAISRRCVCVCLPLLFLHESLFFRLLPHPARP